MKNILMILFAALSFVTAKSKIEFRGNKMFFLNEHFGAIIKTDYRLGITSDGGNSWNDVYFNDIGKLKKILFLNENDGWLIVDDKDVYKTNDGGKSWDEVYIWDQGRFGSIYFISENIGFIGGKVTENNKYETLIFKTVDRGQTWLKAKLDNNFYYLVEDFSFINDTIGMAHCYYNAYKTLDGGNNWTALPIQYYPTEGKYITSCKVLSEKYLLTTINYPEVVLMGCLRKSLDSGESWANFGSNQIFEWGIKDQFIYDKDSIWVLAGSKMYRSYNSGWNWDIKDLQLSSLSFISSQKAYALNDTVLYYTEDGWDTYVVVDSALTDVKDEGIIGEQHELYQNYPNPFNPTTTINYSIPVGGANFASPTNVKLIVYDLLGREVATLVDKDQSPGNYSINYEASKLTSGIYLYRLQCNDFIETKKMLLLR